MITETFTGRRVRRVPMKVMNRLLTKMDKALSSCIVSVAKRALSRMRGVVKDSAIMLAPDIHRDLLEDVVRRYSASIVLGLRRVEVVHINDLLEKFVDWVVRYRLKNLAVDSWISGSGRAIFVSRSMRESSIREDAVVGIHDPSSIAKLLLSSGERVSQERVVALSSVPRTVLMKALRTYLIAHFRRFSEVVIIFDRVYDQRTDVEILRAIIESTKSVRNVSIETILPLNTLDIERYWELLRLALRRAPLLNISVESFFEKLTLEDYDNAVTTLVNTYVGALNKVKNTCISDRIENIVKDSELVRSIVRDSIAIAGASIEALYAADIIIRRLINAVASAEEPLPVEEAYERCVSSVANRITTVIPDTARPLVGVVSRVVGLSPRVVASAMAGLGKVAVDQIENRGIAVVSPETLRRCSGGIAAVDDVARVLEAMSFLGLVTRVSEGSEEYVLGYTPPLIAALRAFRGM